MGKVYEARADGEAPESVVALHRKVDGARTLVERTRGALVTVKKTKDLERKIDGVGRLLDEAEGRQGKRARPRNPDELDVDSAWNKG